MVEKLLTWLELNGGKLFSVLLVFVVGWVLIKLALRITDRALRRTKLEPILFTFILTVLRIVLIILLALTCLDMLGVKTTSLVTALGAAGLALSLALQASLSNLAGGVVLLLTKPFAIGDYVAIGPSEGTVGEIGLVHTILHTVDNKKIYIPNADVSSARITNYTAEAVRRLDLVFSIGYHDDVELAKQTILAVLERNPLAHQDPPPLVRVCAHAASSVDIACRVWVATADYWTLNYDLYEQVKTAFDQAGISIPFNQLDLHMVEGMRQF